MVSKVKVSKKAVRNSVAPKARAGRTTTSRISSQNQVTIPVEVLRNSNLVTGDEVEFIINDQGVVEVKKVVPYNPFQALANAAGDTYIGFDLEEERRLNWD
jgi:bifunctional DNA-binding transcriptional regulator/antitoxin component of YhaV-PrlF toxin-antitoxin module